MLKFNENFLTDDKVYISVWIGTTSANGQNFALYINADASKAESSFANDMDTDFFDEGFLSHNYYEKPKDIKEIIDTDFFYPDSLKKDLLSTCLKMGIKTANSFITLDQYYYSPKIQKTYLGLSFLGCFSYIEEKNELKGNQAALSLFVGDIIFNENNSNQLTDYILSGDLGKTLGVPENWAAIEYGTDTNALNYIKSIDSKIYEIGEYLDRIQRVFYYDFSLDERTQIINAFDKFDFPQNKINTCIILINFKLGISCNKLNFNLKYLGTYNAVELI